jgi:hypothetical protein
MKSEFDNIRLNDKHAYDSDKGSDKEVVNIYCNDKLIAKKKKVKKKIQYFGVKGYEKHLTKKES